MAKKDTKANESASQLATQKTDNAELDVIDFKAKQPLDSLSQQDIPAKRHSMRGFDPSHADIVDYIVRITHRIWEQGDMGHIYEAYGHNCTVHTAYGLSYGIEETISSSVAFLAAFPDRRLYAEDVIWTGDDTQGFHTSHLIVNNATNFGYSPWGPPTNRKARYLAIANCFVVANKIVEEWLVRDTAGIVRQLGLDVHEVASKLAQNGWAAPTPETERLYGQFPPEVDVQLDRSVGGIDEVEAWVKSVLGAIWNGRHFNTVAATHSPDAMMYVPNNTILYGPNHIRTYILNLTAMFPDLGMTVEHVYTSQTPVEVTGGLPVYRVAVRWRMFGTHQNYGWLGEPTGKRANILGVSHIHVAVEEGTPRITKHYFVFDELAVLTQLLA
ncbi:MAG: ester cyclase [Deinococcota bacterium]